MDWLTINGVPPWDGRYPFDIADRELTTREWGWLKRLAGYMPLTIGDGFKGADPELFAVFAVIALHRAGRIQPAEAADTFDRFSDAPVAMAIQIETDVADAGEDEGSPAPFASSSGNENGSGDNSPPSLATSEPTPSPYGTPESVTSVLPPTRSES